MKNRKQIAALAAAITVAASLAACSALDVVKTDSVRAFGDVLDAAEVSENDGSWRLQSLDGTASLLWNGGRAEMVLDASPFVEAGLDLSRLDGAADGNTLRFIRECNAAGGAGSSPAGDFESLMSAGRENLEFHISMDHFNFLMDGGMFMWAKDLGTNDASGANQQHDIAFVVDPEPLIAAGVDPDRVEGWAYLPLSLSVDGRMVPVEMFMKSVNFK